MRIWVQLFEGPAPVKFGRAKIVQNLARFWTTLIANIFGTDQDTDCENGVITYNPFHEKNLVNFGPLTKKV